MSGSSTHRGRCRNTTPHALPPLSGGPVGTVWWSADAPLAYPYVPGLLSWRELPAAVAALERLPRAPDVLLADDNPGVRIGAIEQLAGRRDASAIPILQRLAEGDPNAYIRMKSASTLLEWNVPAETY